jgi:hypothetical protein
MAAAVNLAVEVGGKGLEPSTESSQKSQSAAERSTFVATGASEGDSAPSFVGQQGSHLDPRLKALIEGWSELSEERRAAIIALAAIASTPAPKSGTGA